MFNILNLDTKELVCDENGDPLMYTSGDAANFHCKTLTGRFQPRKIGNDTNWREREISRFKSGDYSLPDYLSPWALPDHFLHVSRDKSGMLAYTPDHIAGAADVQKRISLKGYLEMYHKGLKTQVSDNLILQHTENFKFSDGLKLAFTPEEVAKVYTNFSPLHGQVSASCMRYAFEHLPMHPTCVYAAGDLALAYLTTKDGLTTHRSVVWPEKKLYGRIYGDTGDLHTKLKKRLYQPSRYFGGDYKSFEGARLLAVPIPENPNVYLMPYVDEQNIWGALFDVADPPYFVLTKNTESKRSLYNIRHPHGATGHIIVPVPCDRCNVPVRERQGIHVGRGENIRSSNWCHPCVENFSFYCDGFNARFSKEDMIQRVMSSGETWSDEYFRRNNGYTCGFNGKNYKDRNRAIMVYDDKENGAYWCPGSVKQAAWHSSMGRWYAKTVEQAKVKEGDQDLLWPMHLAKRDAKLVDGVWVRKPPNSGLKRKLEIQSLIPPPPLPVTPPLLPEFPVTGMTYQYTIQEDYQAAAMRIIEGINRRRRDDQ